jgi:serine protease Do
MGPELKAARRAAAPARALVAALTLTAGVAASAQAPSPVPPTPNQPVPSATSEGAREILARVRPSVVRIKGFFGSNTAQAFHGTGFAVAPGGIFMTNYHVVAQQVLYPDKYRLEYLSADGKTGRIAVLAIDAQRDLAVVRADGFAPPPLKFETAVPSKGERAFSIGFPLDVGLTITEGVSNGHVEDSFDPRIHYSGAINGGMSGGPALNTAGAVIGINVSGYRFEQLVSFLVPSAHAQALLDRPIAPRPDGFKQDLTAQMHAHSGALLGALGSPLATQVVSGYALPAKLAPFIDCNASADPSPEQQVQVVRIYCSAKAGLYIEAGLYSGELRFEHYVLTTGKLDAWRFANRLSKFSLATGAHGRRKYVGPFACETAVVELKGFDASVMTCARAHRKLEGLYDITARVTSLNESKRAFASHVDLYGVRFEEGMLFVRRYIEAMEWKP